MPFAGTEEAERTILDIAGFEADFIDIPYSMKLFCSRICWGVVPVAALTDCKMSDGRGKVLEHFIA